jgi:hypothetical protein
MNEAGVRPSPRDLDLQQSRALRLAPPKPAPAAAPNATIPTAEKAAPAVKVAPATKLQKRDVWQAHDVDHRVYAPRGATMASLREPVSAPLKKFLVGAVVIGLMTVAFTAAQFIPAPEWMFSNTGTLVIESSPAGVKVTVNGKSQGVTPLTLKVENGIHEVELHGPGKPKIFKVHVTRGDRVAQYIEFPGR